VISDLVLSHFVNESDFGGITRRFNSANIFESSFYRLVGWSNIYKILCEGPTKVQMIHKLFENLSSELHIRIFYNLLEYRVINLRIMQRALLGDVAEKDGEIPSTGTFSFTQLNASFEESRKLEEEAQGNPNKIRKRSHGEGSDVDDN
jgi:hypothetical protein